VPDTLHIGPLALPMAYLSTLLAILLGLGLAERAARKLAPGLAEAFSGHAWRMALLALVAARLGFVWRFKAAYLQTPLDVLNIRDGGWDPQVGVIAAWVYALVLWQRQPVWRKPLALSVGVASAVWLGGQFAIGAGAQAVQPGLPLVVLQTLDQRDSPLATFKGKPVVLNLWATWCPPCLREMPVLQRGQQAHTDVHYLFVNQGESARQVQDYLVRHGLGLQHVLLDPKGQIAAAFDASAYPSTLFFDAQGRLVARRIGELSWPTLLEKVKLSRQAPP
jgi:thiol-disulfide isomerase/thioredoxin